MLAKTHVCALNYSYKKLTSLKQSLIVVENKEIF